MTPQEQEIAIKELDERVDRLRVLYDQYFLGFEKLEPTVPRKEIDRRFQLLRKESIRNTGLRFKFNVITQKYNTYSMYWTRICRQIEEGTFKRHLAKAKKILEQGLKPRKRKDDDLSLDIDVDFEEDLDMDALLAEAEASVSSHENTASDTVPPAPQPAAKRTPGTSFVVTQRQREVLDEPPPSSREWDIPLGPSAAPGSGPRAPVGAALPAGAKKQIIRKKDGSIGGPMVASPPPAAATTPEPPPSNPRPSTSKIALPPMPGGGRPPISAPRIAAAPAAPPPQSTPRIAVPAPPPASSPRIPVAPQSTPRVALPAMPPRGAGAPASANKLPAAAPPPNSSPRIPAASPSAGRIPLPPPPPRQPRAAPADPDDREKKPQG